MARDEETVEVVVDSITYRAKDGPYAVVRVERTQASPGDAVFHAVGDLGDVREGETLRVTGSFAVHAVHGKRFQIRAFAPLLPSTEAGIARMLAGLPNLGPATSEAIVRRFGSRALDVIATESAKLLTIPGIGKKKAALLREAILERRAEA